MGQRNVAGKVSTSLHNDRRHHAEHTMGRLDVGEDVAVEGPGAGLAAIDQHVVALGVVGLQAFGEKVEADEVFEGADREAKDLFEALKGYASP